MSKTIPKAAIVDR